MTNGFLAPSQSTIEGLASAVARHHSEVAETKAQQKEMERRQTILKQIQRASHIVTAHSMGHRVEQSSPYYMHELTAWTEYQLPEDTGTPSHVELRMEAVYNTIKRRIRARQQGDLLNVKLIMRAYDPLTLVSSDSQDYPLIFKPSGSAGPRIIYNQNRIPYWLPECEDGDMLVQPGTTEWRQVDDILSHFEDLDT